MSTKKRTKSKREDENYIKVYGDDFDGQRNISDEEKQSLIDHTLLNRTGTIDDVVKACLFIIKDAPYMTGSVIRLDGGYLLGGEAIPPMPKGIV